MIDYNVASKTYDNTRSHSEQRIQHFASKVNFDRETVLLDYGCGTGNYLHEIQKRFGCRCCGVEPSDGMRAAALTKNATLDIRSGDHRQIPFDDSTFDFAYMTDVIHHVPDLPAMFSQLSRVIKTGGRLCIVTQSHAQIEGRFYNRYFPSVAGNEKQRYPDVPRIVETATQNGFTDKDAEILHGSPTALVSDAFIRNVEERNFSMFRTLDEQEFSEGLEKVKADRGRPFEQNHQETCLWFKRSS